jgi:hypothetical protein
MTGTRRLNFFSSARPATVLLIARLERGAL